MDRITLYFLSIFIYGLLEPELWRFTLGRRRRCCACPALLVGLVNRELFEARALSLCSLLQQSSAKRRSAGWQPWVQSWSKLVLVTISPDDNQWSWTWQWGPSAGVKDEPSPGLQEQFTGVLAAAGMGRVSAWIRVPVWGWESCKVRYLVHSPLQCPCFSFSAAQSKLSWDISWVLLLNKEWRKTGKGFCQVGEHKTVVIYCRLACHD